MDATVTLAVASRSSDDASAAAAHGIFRIALLAAAGVASVAGQAFTWFRKKTA